MSVITLNVISGTSALSTRTFPIGTPAAPFSVGSRAEWQITAADVDGAHLYLAFDGQRLHVAAVSPGSNIFVAGLEVGTAFVPLPVPCNLFFGAACIAVTSESNGPRATPLSAIIRATQRLPDLSRTDRMQTQLFDLSRTMQLRTERLEVPEDVLASLRNAPAAEPLANRTQSHEVAAPRTFTLSGTLDMASTLYDGGALRERAAQFASSSVAPLASPAVEPIVPASNWLAKSRAAFQRYRLPRQLALLLLLPLLALAIWGMARPHTTTVVARPSVGAPAAPRALAANRNVVASSPPLLASVNAVPEDERLLPAALPSDNLERAALGAAFSGNRTEAAALYDRLAAKRDSRLFSLAARLAREDRVRKP